MERFKQGLMRFWSDEEGATVVEYAVMLALIIAVAIVTIDAVGEKVDAAFNDVKTSLDGVSS